MEWGGEGEAVSEVREASSSFAPPPYVRARSGAVVTPPVPEASACPASSSSESAEVELTEEEKVEKARHQIAREVLETERSYVESLTTMINMYKRPLIKLTLEPKAEFKEADITLLFSNIEQLFSLNIEILKQLDARLRSWSPEQKIGDIILSFAPFLKMYNVYSNNYDEALQLYNKLQKESPKFSDHLQQTKQKSGTHMTLEHLLIMPVQRIPRYNLLLRDLLNKTQPSHPDFEPLNKALIATESVSQHINTSKGRADNLKKLISQPGKGKGFQGLIKADRHLIADGMFRVFDGTHRSKTNCILSQTDKTESPSYKLHLYLFNDLLVYATGQQVKKHKDMSKLKSQFPLSHVWVKDRGQLNSFDIITPTHYFVFISDDDRIKMKWIKLLQTQIIERAQRTEKERQESKLAHPEDDLYSSEQDSDDSDDDLVVAAKNSLTPSRRFLPCTFFDPPLTALYRGWWFDGLMHGQGELQWAGNRYVGEFAEGDRVGLGMQIFATGERYDGMWSKNLMHGMGTLLYPNGDKYTGTFKNNTFQGRGAIKFANGNTFEGNFEDGLPQGKGTLVFTQDNLRYDGDFAAGIFHGQGTLTWADSRCYQGEWRSGFYHGVGVLNYGNGFIYNGSWRSGLRHGPGKLTNQTNQTMYEGEWLNDAMAGNGKLQLSFATFSGKFDDGDPTRGDFHLSNGDIYSGSFKYGALHGSGCFTSAIGVKWDGNWEKGKRNDKFTAIIPAGRLTAHCSKDGTTARLALADDAKITFDILPVLPVPPSILFEKFT